MIGDNSSEREHPMKDFIRYKNYPKQGFVNFFQMWLFYDNQAGKFESPSLSYVPLNAGNEQFLKQCRLP